MTRRAILHVDMDAFFASVAQLDDPSLRGKPVVVGGHTTRRGVVASASYEARAYGIHSAMPMYQARERCPHLICVPSRMERYREVQHQLIAIWERFAPAVQPLGFEEAYLDMTGTEALMGPLEAVAHRVRQAILDETRLSASVGGGSSKLLAKIASKRHKPGGVGVVPVGAEEAWLHPLPVSSLPGVGPKTEERLHKLRILTIGQLAEVPLEVLQRHFGSQGADLHAIALGLDPRPVTPMGPPKSVGGEETFWEDTVDLGVLRRHVRRIVTEVGYRLRRHALRARTVTAKFRYGRTFETAERSLTLTVPTDDDDRLFQVAWELLLAGWDARRSLRLVGVSVSHLAPTAQLALFETPEHKGRELHRALDRLRDRFGEAAVQRGSLVKRPHG